MSRLYVFIKYSFLISISLFFLTLALMNAFVFLDDIIEKKNIENLRDVRIGMTSSQLIKVMGTPDSISESSEYQGKQEYFYKVDAEEYLNARIYVDEVGIVSAIYNPSDRKNPYVCNH